MRNQIVYRAAYGCVLAVAGCALPGINREQADSGTETEVQAEAFGDPEDDPKNRNEDRAAFEALLPKQHNFAEWPMPDSAPGSEIKPIYAVSDQVVIDKVTNLRWQRELPELLPGCKGRYPLKGLPQAEGTGCTWEEARTHCEKPEIAEQLGPGEWRLPTKIELESLLDVTRIEAIDPVLGTYPTDFFWSATPVLNPEGLNMAWAVDFSDGYPYMSGRFKAGRVRCVASSEQTDGSRPDHALDDGDVLRDNHTKLTWQRFPDSKTRKQGDAKSYCEELDLDGTGWRLPYLKELLTIVDPTRRMPAVHARSFPLTPNARFWTDSVRADAEDEAYQVDFEMGAVLFSSMNDEHFVRCVR